MYFASQHRFYLSTLMFVSNYKLTFVLHLHVEFIL